MKYPVKSVLASMLALAFSGNLQAASNTDNITFFSGYKASNPQDVLKKYADQFGLPSDLGNLVLTRVQESLTGKHYYY